jgi:putative endonuclease
MMQYVVYILYSFSHHKSYVGYTNDLVRRLWEHNNATQSSFTSRFRPWDVIYTESFDTKSAAMAREKWFKTGVGRRAKEDVITSYLAANTENGAVSATAEKD